MTANPIELIGGLASTSDVSKADIVGWAKSRVPQVMANAAEINATNLAGQLIVMVNALGTFYYLDPTDTTSPNDPPEVIVSLDNKRFKPLSSVPFPTTSSLGGVYASAAVPNQFLTGVGGDGHVTRAQPAATDLSDGVTGTDQVVRSTSPHIVTPTGIVKGDVGLGNVDNTSDTSKWAAAVALTNKTINAALNTISNLATSMFAANVVDTDTTLAANSDSRLASQKAVKAYVDALLNANDAMQFKGVIDCSANPNYPAANAGYVYRVSVAGKIGGASGTVVEAGDQLLCITDGTSAGTQAAVGANWSITQSNIDGAVIGPASAVSGNIATFNGTTGKLIQDGGKALPSGSIVGTSDTQTLTGKTLTSPAINTPTISGGTHDGLTSLGFRSTGAAFDIKLATGEVLTGTRTLSWVLGDANRTLTLGGNATLNGGTHSGTNTGDQTITLTGDVTGSGTGSFATTIGANKVTLAMMATIATARFLGRTSASTGNVESLTTAQATALLDVMVGDTGTGGTKGLVPAPGAGDAAAGKYLKADGTYAVPAGGGGGGMSDTERQNLMSTTAYQSKSFAEYRRLVNLFATGFKGASDALNGILTGSSSNYTTTPGTAGATTGNVAPSTVAPSTVTSGSANPAGGPSTGFNGATYVNETTALTNGVTYEKIGVYADAASTWTMKIVKRNSSTSVDVVVSQSFSHPGGGWADLTLSSPYTVPGSGTYYVGGYLATNISISFNTSQMRLTTASDITGSGQAVTEASGSPPSFRATTLLVINNMTVVTTMQTTDAAVSNARVLLEFDNTAGPALNTDLTVEVTCNGGTNWTAATLSAVTAYGQSGRKIAETADTACTSGTSFGARVKTANGKSVPIYALTLLVH